jgi:hypothetical protein
MNVITVREKDDVWHIRHRGGNEVGVASGWFDPE